MFNHDHDEPLDRLVMGALYFAFIVGALVGSVVTCGIMSTV